MAAASASARAERLAVLSADAKPYREALEGAREALGGDLRSALATDGESAEGALAFGARAALAAPGSERLVVALTPVLPHRPPAKRLVVVSTLPRPVEVVAMARRLRPGAKILHVPWSSPDLAGYMRELVEAGRGAGLRVEAERVDPGRLPEMARLEHAERADIVWLPPDPALLTRENFEIIVQSERSRRVPVIAPLESLLERGAAASFGPSFRAMGRAAGEALRALEEGRSVPEIVYAERSELTLAAGGVSEYGLAAPREAAP